MAITQTGNLIQIVVGEQLACEQELLLDLSYGSPRILHFGLPTGVKDLSDFASTERPWPKGTLDTKTPDLMTPEHGSGWFGKPGLTGHHQDRTNWAPRFQPDTVSISDASVCVTAVDQTAGLRLETEFLVCATTIHCRVGLTNMHDQPFFLNDLTLTVPIPRRSVELMHFTGRWAKEFTPERFRWEEGVHAFDNRRGRTSHDRPPILFSGTKSFTENAGEVWAAALGWSGNSVVQAEQLTDGRRLFHIGELLTAGEIALGNDESYSSPWLELGYSNSGLNGISHIFHESIRSRDGYRASQSPRPIILNTWEAIYFDHDLDKLTALADKASAVGVERFVLDDGWFHGRRDDKAGLGDWWIDETVWPEGLTPLIDHVTKLGMDFGIWVEPEMVNPNSELYRAHPEWVLADSSYPPILGRNQLVLDMGRPEVRAYLFSHLDCLLSDHDIAYVKWDLNRDVVHGSRERIPAMHAHVKGVYQLLDDLRDKHNNVEIETCASGGGRIDFEILKRTDRVWVSDNNDGSSRQEIQRGYSVLYPPEIMGCHIGPTRAHTTARTHSLGFRAATAFFGHLGVEWNLLDTPDHDRQALKEIIDSHKQARHVLHTGRLWRIDIDDDSALAFIVVSKDQREAYLSYAQLDQPKNLVPEPFLVPGLKHGYRYSANLVNLGETPPTGPVAGGKEDDFLATGTGQPAWYLNNDTHFSGSVLAHMGLQPPLLFPNSAFVLHLKAKESAHA